MDYEKKIDIPFGAHDSELKGWEYTIPEGFTAEIKDGKVIVREKESEDERIRKALINHFKSHSSLVGENWNGIECDDIIAYLEKQKEEEGYEAIPVESTLEYKLGFKAGKESEKQKGQKPIEDIVKDITKNKEVATKFLKSAGIMDENGELAEMYRSEQKPAEWSDEDERKLQRCIEIVEYWEGDYDIAYAPYSNFLNSLRPSWKPSEEQMEALRSVLEHEAERVGTSKYLEKANFLYEQLQKLI